MVARHGCLILKEKAAGGRCVEGGSDLDRYGHGALPANWSVTIWIYVLNMGCVVSFHTQDGSKA